MDEPTEDPQPGPTFGLAPEVGKAVTYARLKINRLLQTAELQNDPLRHVLEVQSDSLAAFHKLFLDGTLKLGASVEKTRAPLNTEDVDRISQDLKSQVANMNRAYGARTFLGAAMVVVGLSLASGYAGVWLGFREGLAETDVFRAMNSENTQQWLRLMRANGSITEAVKLCGGPAARQVDTHDGRHACAVPMYLDLPPKDHP